MKIALIGYGWLAKHFHEFLNDQYSGLEIYITNTQEKESFLTNSTNSVVASKLIVEKDSIDGERDWLSHCDRVFCFLTPKEDYPLRVQKLHQACSLVSKFILVSSTGVFSEPGTYSESSSFEALTPRSKKLKAAEDTVLSKKNGFVIRSSGQIGPERYPAKSLAQKADQEIEDTVVNVIHSDDLVRVLDLFLDNHFTEKVVHAVSPYHPQKSQFYGEQAQRLGLSLPIFKKSSSEKIINSEVLKKVGFVFKNAACV